MKVVSICFVIKAALLDDFRTARDNVFKLFRSQVKCKTKEWPYVFNVEKTLKTNYIVIWTITYIYGFLSVGDIIFYLLINHQF